MKVWAIFSIANNYDQPDNNLEALYATKPNFEQLRDFFFSDKEITDIEDENIIMLVDILKGKEVIYSDTAYRVQEVEVKE